MSTTEISMLRYIQETPDQVRANIGDSKNLTRRMVDLFLSHPYRTIWLVACGSSCNACHCARYYMKSRLGAEVKIVTPFTFNHYEHDMTPEDFVVCISQSGCSTNTIESLRLCRKLGVPAIGLTGNIHSDFKNEADEVIDFGLGSEKLDFVTKGVVTLTAFLMLFALHAARAQNILSDEDVIADKKQMMACMDSYDALIAAYPAYFEANKQKLLSMERVYLIGAGANYGTVLEGAVKIGETVHILAVGYEIDESIHGPQIQLTPNYNLFFLDPDDETSTRIRQEWQAAQKITDRVFALSNNPDLKGTGVMRVPAVEDELFSPLYSLAFVQLTAYYVAETNYTWHQHPLLQDFKTMLSGKSDTYKAYDCT